MLAAPGATRGVGPGSDVEQADLSVLPLDADAIRVCELCGTLGLKRNFYPRNNTYCSLYCYRRKAKNRTYRFILMGSTEHLDGMIPMEPLPQIAHPWPAALQDLMRPMPQKIQLVSNSYEWKDELFGCDFLAAPVKLFKHAPLHDMWDNTFEGMKVEVKNLDCEQFSDRLSDYFWVATVIKVKGYMGLLRYEGFNSDDSKDFWVNLCCSEVHPVGWCATRGKPLIPPKSIEDKYSDWKKFLVRQLTGARTLPADFYNKLAESVKSRFSIGTILEVVDKNRISQVKVASVYEIIGKRLHVKYYDSSPEDNGFWCHEDSPLIHHVGWAFAVGHPLDAPPTYCERVAAGRLLIHDATPNMFYRHPCVDPAVPLFREGMKLEAIDPLNLSSVCAATVMKVLHEGYMMIRIDVYPADASGADWFCYHQRSPCIFPVGFSAANNIRLVPPAGYTPEQFAWREYLAGCGGAAAAGPELFAARSSVEHGFVAGMRLECADLMDPRLVCVATVARVVGNLLKVHFDGWGEEYDQWLWGHSTDMYPVGWCRAVGHRLEGPLQPAPPPRPARPARRPRAIARKRKIRQAAAAPTEVPARASSQTSQTSITTEDYSQNSNDLVDTKSLSPPGFSSESNPGDQALGVPTHEDHDLGAPTLDGQASGSPILEEQVPEAPDLEEHGPGSPYFEDHAPGVLEPGKQTSVALDPGEQSPDAPIPGEQNGNGGEEMEVAGKNAPMDSPTDEVLEDEMKFVEEPSDKVIPRLVNNSLDPATLNCIDPENWTSRDVARFLAVNDCSPYGVHFGRVTGSAMLQLSKDEIIELLEMKVGPSLKIFDLIQQLKCKIKPVQRRNFK